VRRPGLYSLADGDRVADLLRAAGGPTRAADLDRLNLAAPVADGSQVMVPRRGEPAPPLTTEPGDPAGLPAPVDVNRAGPEELETLPGVGPATAAAIIEFREANGGFATVEDLIDVPGIGEAKLAALTDLVTV
jgi:competence protein ComEA